MKNQGKDKKVALIIMDGWGKELDKSRSAIAKAHTPNVDSFYNDYPNSTLVTYGEQVGLPAGQMGNSEVGHMNLGAGRIVYQELQRINKAIEDKSLAQNLVLQKMFHYAKNNDKTLHLMGLVSDGGVHSHIRHIEALCQYAANFGLQKIYIHAFTDGRDCAPESGLGLLTDLEKNILNTPAKISTIIGRYYAMDRDKRWNRIKLAYDLMLKGQGEVFSTTKEAIQSSYDSDITDEFITPKVIDKNGMIQEGDAVLCFNFRTDRCREITTVFTQQNMPDEGMTTLPLHYVTMTRYDNRFKNVNVMLEKDDLKNTLGEILAKNGKT
ncbi:MAG: 2,3-bisphosphoglycerate-independent phosphoglycerate mutase, partial [Chitinophagales bacterium]